MLYCQVQEYSKILMHSVVSSRMIYLESGLDYPHCGTYHIRSTSTRKFTTGYMYMEERCKEVCVSTTNLHGHNAERLVSVENVLYHCDGAGWKNM